MTNKLILMVYNISVLHNSNLIGNLRFFPDQCLFKKYNFCSKIGINVFSSWGKWQERVNKKILVTGNAHTSSTEICQEIPDYTD
jgi:hypothetical protein